MNCLVIGCGKMGSAIVQSWCTKKLFTKYCIVDPNVKDLNNLMIVNDVNKIPKDFNPDIVLLSIKPQVADKILKYYSKYNKALILSIMAGKSIKYIQNYFGKNAKIVRIMPNLCAKIGKSSSLVCYSKNMNLSDKKTANSLISSFGKVIQLEEKKFHEGTVFFGCSPAFFYALCEEFINVMRDKYDFSDNDANCLMKDIFVSSAEYFKNENKENGVSFKTLKENVASKGGVTQASLDVLEPVLQKNVYKIVKAGVKRSKILAQPCPKKI